MFPIEPAQFPDARSKAATNLPPFELAEMFVSSVIPHRRGEHSARNIPRKSVQKFDIFPVFSHRAEVRPPYPANTLNFIHRILPADNYLGVQLGLIPKKNKFMLLYLDKKIFPRIL